MFTYENEICPDTASLDRPNITNEAVVQNYPVGDSANYLRRLGLVGESTPINEGSTAPVIVLATSSNHFSECNALIDQLVNDVTPKFKIVLYDIGLSNKEHMYIKKKGDCEVRYFPFNEFPAFVEDDLETFAWKPLLIQIMLKEFGFVIWIDSGIYIPDKSLQTAVEVAEQEGIAISYRNIEAAGADYELAYATDKRTFAHLGESPCAFRNTFQFQASFIAVKRTSRVLQNIMRPWVSCALTKSCQVLDRTSSTCSYSKTYGSCHKFDQSVLSIILNRLYHDSLYKINLSPRMKLLKCYYRERVMIMGDASIIFTSDPSGNDCPPTKWIKLY